MSVRMPPQAWLDLRAVRLRALKMASEGATLPDRRHGTLFVRAIDRFLAERSVEAHRALLALCDAVDAA